MFNNIIVDLFLFVWNIFDSVNSIILSESFFEWNIFNSRWSHLDLVSVFSNINGTDNSLSNNSWLNWHNWGLDWSLNHNLGLLNGDWSLNNLWSLLDDLHWSKLWRNHRWSHHHWLDDLWSDVCS